VEGEQKGFQGKKSVIKTKSIF